VAVDWKRFWMRVVRYPGEACWLWRGAKASGYGRMRVDGRLESSHRLAWAFEHGALPEPGKVVCHRCDNRGCCRPDHLFLGTYGDNAQDAVNKGRMHPVWRRSVIDEETVRLIREAVAAGEAQRAVARRFGCSQQHVSKLARGERRANPRT
jgi:hypothetical protein